MQFTEQDFAEPKTFTEADFAERPAFTEADFADAPGAVSTARGLVASAQRGVKQLIGLPTQIEAAGAQGLGQPTLMDRRRAFVQTLSDPEYWERLARDESPPAQRRVEKILGPEARLDRTMTGGQVLQEEIAKDVAQFQTELAALPKSEAQQRLAAATSSAEKWAAWRKDPFELTASIVLESLPPSLAGAAVGGGAGSVALGVGLSSGTTTFASEFLNQAQALGYDVTDPDRLRAFLNHEVDFQKAFRPAAVKSGVIGQVDAATGGLAGRFVEPALKRGLARVLLASGKEAALQAAGGSGGEYLGSVAAGQKPDLFDVAMEGIAEIASGPAEIIGNVRQARADTGRPGAPKPEARPITPAPILDEFGGEAKTPSPDTTLPANVAPAPAESGAAAAESDNQRFAREQREASAALARIRAEEAETIPAASVAPSRATVPAAAETVTPPESSSATSRGAGTPVSPTEAHRAEAREILRAEAEASAAPDLLDEIEGGVSRGTILFPPDYADALNNARDRASQSQFQQPYAKLRQPQRAQIDRQLRASTTEGTPADQVLTGLQRENPKYADWNVNQFADAVLAAGEGRATPREPNPAAVQRLAEEIAVAEGKGHTQTVNAPVSNLGKQLPRRKLKHGTSARQSFNAFASDLVYLAEDESEAKAFAENPILGGGRGEGEARVLTVETPAGQAKDINAQVEEAIMNDDDLDAVIEAEAQSARKQGFDYLTFQHPSADPNRDTFEVTVALNPAKLNIETPAPVVKPKPAEVALTDTDLRTGDQHSRQWRNTIPTFQGGKRKMAAIVSAFIRKAWTKEQREAITEVHDYFGGSGGWGLFNVLSHFPNARKLLIREFEPVRLLKIELFQTQGNRFGELFRQSPVAKLYQEAKTAMASEGVTSANALTDRLRRRAEKLSNPVDQAIAQAIIDHGEASFATATVDNLVRLVSDNAAQSFRAAEAFRKRGGTIEYTQGDSFAVEPDPRPDVLSILDPPYPGTAGYQTSTVGLGIFNRTSALIKRLRDAGQNLLYTDSAWWEKSQGQGDFELDIALANLEVSLTHRAYANEGANRIIIGGNVVARPAIAQRTGAGQPVPSRQTERPVPATSRVSDRAATAGQPVAGEPAAKAPTLDAGAEGVAPENIPFSLSPAHHQAQAAIAATQAHVTAVNTGNAPVRVLYDPRLVGGLQMWRGTVSPGGVIGLNAAAPEMSDPAIVAQVFRHELAHRELMSEEGQRQQERLVGKLTQTQRAELQALGYTNFLNLSPDAYERWLTNEFIARQAEQDTAWWQRYVQHVADWLRGRKGLADITNEEVARAILRAVKAESGKQKAESGQPYSLAQTDTRRLSRQIDAATWLTPEQKATLTNRIYNVANIPAAKAAAADLLQSLGLTAAQNLILDPSISIPGAVRAQLMQAVARELARTSPAQYADFMNRVIAQTTDAGQYIAHLKGWTESTPDGAVATAVRILDGVTDKVLASYRDLLSAARQALSAGHASAKADTLRAEPVQQAAAEAVDEAITKDKDVQAAIRTEARENLVNDPDVRKAAASALPPGTDISDVLNVVLEHFRFTGETPAPLKDKLTAAGVPAQYAEGFAKSLEAAWVRKVKAIEDSIPKHLRDLRLSRQVLALAQAIVNGLKPSADSARARLRSRFNPSPAPGAAMSLSKQPAPSVLDDLAEVGALMLAEQDLTAEQFNAALLAEFGDGIKAQLPQAYPKAKARLEAEAARHGQRRITRRAKSAAGQEIKATALNRLLRDKLKQWNLTLGQALQNPQNGRKLGDAIVTDAKLEGVQAERLRERINGLFDKLARDRKQKLLAKLERDQAAGKKARSIVQATRQAIALDNAGALDDAGYRELIRQALGLKSLTAQEAANLRALAQKIQAIPEGQEQAREEAAQKLAHAIGRLRPGHWWDFPLAFWYANILSGPTTHMVNALSNALNLAGTLAAKTVQNPASLQQILPQLARGARQAVPEMVHALQTGSVTGPRLGQKFNDPGVWERVDSRWALPWKLVGRALAAGDMLFFYPAYQVEQGLLARNLARKEGASGQRLNRRVAEILGNTEAVRSSAGVQATQEGYTGLKHRRRVEEIIQQRRDDLGNFTEAGREFALRTTFNNKPYGLLGAVAGAINAVSARFPIARLVVPFTNIIANVVNESINYTPVGSLRALATRYGGANLYGKEADLTAWADKDTLAELHAKAAIGTLLLGALVFKAASHADDDDPPFAITGQGPSDPAKRKTWLAAGNLPNSIKLGNRSYSYLNTPVAVPLAIVGNLFDAWKYKHLDEAGALDRAAYGVAMSGKTLVQQSFLDSLARLAGAVEHPSATRGGDRLADWAGRTGSSFVVPNAVRQVNQVFDPDKFEAHTVQGELLRHIPFVRSNLKPTLNGLGEPVTRPWTERFTKPENPDPVWRELARLNVGVYPTRLEWRGEPLSEEQLYRVVELSGPRIRVDLEKLLARPQWEKLNVEIRRRAAQAVIEARHTQAKATVMR